MRVTIVYDNLARDGLQSDWGFSCMIGDSTLFDTGRSLPILKRNLSLLKIDESKIRRVIISHNHKDHLGGIGLLEGLNDVEVFVPRSFPQAIKQSISSFGSHKLFEVKEPTRISENIFSLGELGNQIKEQSVILETEHGRTLITGCAHPGLDYILDMALKQGPIDGVIGGFHGFSRLLALEGTSLIVPCHCTEKKDEILSLYRHTARECTVGATFDV